eukprot:1673908-Pyramimonas_sp.AAC.1
MVRKLLAKLIVPDKRFRLSGSTLAPSPCLPFHRFGSSTDVPSGRSMIKHVGFRDRRSMYRDMRSTSNCE